MTCRALQALGVALFYLRPGQSKPPAASLTKRDGQLQCLAKAPSLKPRV